VQYKPVCYIWCFQMMLSTTKILMEAFEDFDSEQKVAKLMRYLDWNQRTLHCYLDSSNFSCVLNIILKHLCCKLNEVLEINLEVGSLLLNLCFLIFCNVK
jgi:hypothetical protein